MDIVIKNTVMAFRPETCDRYGQKNCAGTFLQKCQCGGFSRKYWEFLQKLNSKNFDSFLVNK